jgi:hypothetical protein
VAVCGISFSFPLPFGLQNHTTNCFRPYGKSLRIPSGKPSKAARAVAGAVGQAGLSVVVHCVGGEARQIRCPSRFSGCGRCASGAGEPSTASAMRAAPRRFGKTRSTITNCRDSLTESLRCAVQYSTGTPDGPQDQTQVSDWHGWPGAAR